MRAEHRERIAVPPADERRERLRNGIFDGWFHGAADHPVTRQQACRRSRNQMILDRVEFTARWWPS
jgi:hypothetical protein